MTKQAVSGWLKNNVIGLILVAMVSAYFISDMNWKKQYEDKATSTTKKLAEYEFKQNTIIMAMINKGMLEDWQIDILLDIKTRGIETMENYRK